MGAAEPNYMINRADLKDLCNYWQDEAERLTEENKVLADIVKRQNAVIASYKEALARAITAIEGMNR